MLLLNFFLLLAKVFLHAVKWLHIPFVTRGFGCLFVKVFGDSYGTFVLLCRQHHHRQISLSPLSLPLL